MPFIGQQPTTGAFLELDSLTASATANYTLQLNGANYYPESVNNLLVSINGVIQGSSTMSLNGAVLTVGATLSASDVIDFVRVFGNVGTISTPTDGSVTVNKLGTGAVTNAKIANDAGIVGSKLGTGAVLQVVSANATTETSFTDTSFVATSTTLSITPTSSSNKVLVSTVLPIQSGSSGIVSFTLYRNSTNLGDSSVGFGRFYDPNKDYNATMLYLDSPSTTSATTYTVYIKTSASTAYYNIANATSTIVAQEIGG